jgi:hypothetical protein
MGVLGTNVTNKAFHWLLGAHQVSLDKANTALAQAPLGFHFLDTPVSRMHSKQRLPVGK